MALKIALFAALCVAQAFAFQPSFLDFVKNVQDDNQSRRDMNYDVFVDCFKYQRVGIRKLGDRLPEVPVELLELMSESLHPFLAPCFKRLEAPLENIGYTMIDGHRVILNYLRKYDVTSANKETVERMKQVASDLEVVRGELQKCSAEAPELEVHTSWLYRALLAEFDTANTFMRKTLGKCLAERKI